MNKKLVFIGNLALILALGLVFASCPNEIQDVNITSNNVQGPAAPSGVEVFYNHSQNKLYFTWTAEAPGLINYRLVYTQEEKNTYLFLDSVIPPIDNTKDPPQHNYDGPRVQKPNGSVVSVDLWECEVSNVSDYIQGKFIFGVIAYDQNNVLSTGSIMWMENQETWLIGPVS